MPVNHQPPRLPYTIHPTQPPAALPHAPRLIVPVHHARPPARTTTHPARSPPDLTPPNPCPRCVLFSYPRVDLSRPRRPALHTPPALPHHQHLAGGRPPNATKTSHPPLLHARPRNPAKPWHLRSPSPLLPTHQPSSSRGTRIAAKPPTLYPPPCIRPLQHLFTPALRTTRTPPTLQLSNFPTSRKADKPTSRKVGKLAHTTSRAGQGRTEKHPTAHTLQLSYLSFLSSSSPALAPSLPYPAVARSAAKRPTLYPPPPNPLRSVITLYPLRSHHSSLAPPALAACLYPPPCI